MAGDDGIAAKYADEVGKELLKEIFAAEIGDDALLDLTAEPEGLDDSDVLVDGAIGGGDFDGANEHAESITTDKREIKMPIAK